MERSSADVVALVWLKILSSFSPERIDHLLAAAGRGAAGAVRAVDATGTGRGAGGARIPEAALVAFPPPLPNGLQYKIG